MSYDLPSITVNNAGRHTFWPFPPVRVAVACPRQPLIACRWPPILALSACRGAEEASNQHLLAEALQKQLAEELKQAKAAKCAALDAAKQAEIEVRASRMLCVGCVAAHVSVSGFHVSVSGVWASVSGFCVSIFGFRAWRIAPRWDAPAQATVAQILSQEQDEQCGGARDDSNSSHSCDMARFSRTRARRPSATPMQAQRSRRAWRAWSCVRLRLHSAWCVFVCACGLCG